MKLLICPDSFKGTLRAEQVASTVWAAARAILPEVEARLLPMSDGGEGSGECFAFLGATRRTLSVTGPDGTPLEAGYMLLPDGKTAYVESAEACGLEKTSRRDPSAATTFGVGELIRDAASHAETILLGLGGSATNDMGLGMLAALGFTFYNTKGETYVPVGKTLSELASFTPPTTPLPRVKALCDVTNPLYGPLGAAAIYGPQKGADREMVERLDRGLRHASDIIAPSLAAAPGTGAAGGLGFAVKAALGGELAGGFDLISQAVGLPEALEWADLVITGEGKLDHQSVMGKVIGGIAGQTRARGIPLIAVCGMAEESDAIFEAGVSAVFPCTRYKPNALPSPEEAETALYHTCENIFRTLRIQ
ncbi:MAG: glycerate kinase [Clostridia bacterium]|nr:glycerate kinase [Clostridia bacterium]